MRLDNLFYAVINWINRPSTSTPLGQTNLNHMDNGILQCAQYIVSLSQDKAENTVVNQMVKSVTVDADTGIITVTQQNGSVKQYDFDIEKVVLNFDINDQNQLVLTLDDGTQKIVDLTRFVYAVDSSATISMQMVNRKIIANIVDGSVTMDKLEPSIQSTFLQYKLDAQAAKDAALTYSQDAERWAVGNEAGYEGSSTDNAKFYCEHAQNYSEIAQNLSQINYPEFEIDTNTGQLTSTVGRGLNFFIDIAGHLITEVTANG